MGRLADVYAAVEAIVLDDALFTASVCDVLGVSRSAYYAWRDGEPSDRERQESEEAEDASNSIPA